MKLDAGSVFASRPKLKEIKLRDGFVLWLEQRSDEGGRTTALIRPLGNSNLSAQELTSFPCDVRTRIHGYGGGAFASAISEEQLWLAWVDDTNASVWTQCWKLNNSSNQEKTYFSPVNQSICLSRTANVCFGDGLIDLKRMIWIGIMEKEKKDYLVTFSLFDQSQDPNIIYQAKDFIGYPTLSPNSEKLAWVEWQSLSMPWDQSKLLVGSLSNRDKLISINTLLGDSSDIPVSVFQPTWFNNNKILISEDESGWWNLKLIELCITNNLIKNSKNIHRIEAEFALPQWVAGMSTISVYDEKIVALSCKDSMWRLNIITEDSSLKNIDIPFDDLSYLDSDNDYAVMFASNSYQDFSILEVDLNKNVWTNYFDNSSLPILQENISVGESFWFNGFNDHLTHAWYYPPVSGYSAPSPLLVKIHSGPTSMASRGLNLGIQFWTSRGWSVVDVNYSGSSGFGRDYRDRLKRAWGHADVFDCCAAALKLVELGKVNEEYIAIEGSSAGGFTALACLSSSNIFKVAACKYPVTDLISMQKKTHRFEASYLDHLLGTFSDNKSIYIDRSPINNIDKINTPIIFFHGLKDNVVHFEQVNQFISRLKNNSIAVELKTFPNEGHGFHDIKVKIEALELTEKFFLYHLGI
ncbi:Esterase/lipase/thioesterase family active site [Prochlorococcus sp. MIT 0602]|nr:Esterase/lipase/thioesterase family active site [Prochlorococcus sp. MIT 0602]